VPVVRVIPAGDLAVEGGDFLSYEDLELIRQTISCRLKFGREEWFLDEREGMPYYERILVKNPDLSAIRALYKRVILSVPGVLSVPTIALSLDRATRTLRVAFEAVCRSGTVVVEPGDEGFVIPVAA
jgi:hypothetical protein